MVLVAVALKLNAPLTFSVPFPVPVVMSKVETLLPKDELLVTRFTALMVPDWKFKIPLSSRELLLPRYELILILPVRVKEGPLKFKVCVRVNEIEGVSVMPMFNEAAVIEPLPVILLVKLASVLFKTILPLTAKVFPAFTFNTSVEALVLFNVTNAALVFAAMVTPLAFVLDMVNSLNVVEVVPLMVWAEETINITDTLPAVYVPPLFAQFPFTLITWACVEAGAPFG